MARVVDHIEHVAELAGLGAVGLGPDFLDQVFTELYPTVESMVVEGVDAKTYVPGLEGPSGLPLVTEELVEGGELVPVEAGVDGNLIAAEGVEEVLL